MRLVNFVTRKKRLHYRQEYKIKKKKTQTHVRFVNIKRTLMTDSIYSTHEKKSVRLETLLPCIVMCSMPYCRSVSSATNHQRDEVHKVGRKFTFAERPSGVLFTQYSCLVKASPTGSSEIAENERQSAVSRKGIFGIGTDNKHHFT